jgi:HD-GYP domain-containing protein (c-di-GMP phosphodiesterase class II)
LSSAVPIILYHHERWNGEGYPFGLAGEAIPIDARVIAVADSFDALTVMRTYREALPLAEACQEIVACRGIQYDPAIVDAFLVAWQSGKIEEIFVAFPG